MKKVQMNFVKNMQRKLTLTEQKDCLVQEH